MPVIERLLAIAGCLLMVGGYLGLLALAKDSAIRADETAAAMACITGMAVLLWLLVRRA